MGQGGREGILFRCPVPGVAASPLRRAVYCCFDLNHLTVSIATQYYSKTIDPKNTAVFLILLPFIFSFGFYNFFPSCMEFRGEAVFQSVKRVYSENVNMLFSVVGDQRDDFNNHLATLHAMLTLGQYDEANRYIEELSSDVRKFNEVINIGILSGLVQSKVVQSECAKIDFQFEIRSLKDVRCDAKIHRLGNR